MPGDVGGAAVGRTGGLHRRDGAASASRASAIRTQTIDDVAYSLEPLLELVRKHESEGLGEAPYPPQFPKAEGEPARVQPSRKKKT